MANLVLDITPFAQFKEVMNDAFFSPIRLAIAAENAGIDGLAVLYSPQHPVITKDDVEGIKKTRTTALNMLVPFHPEAIRHAQSLAPDMVTLIALTGNSMKPQPLPVAEMQEDITGIISDLKANNISTALFIPPEFDTLKVAGKLEIDAVLLDCRSFTEAPDSNARLLAEENLQTTARGAYKLGLGVELMGGIEQEHLPSLSKIPFVEDIIVGKALIKRSFFNGLDRAIQQMRLMFAPEGETM